MTCGCVVDEDELVSSCPEHDQAAQHREYRLQQLIGAELDAVVRELAGRAPTRIERKSGATGMFAVARSGGVVGHGA